jgi:hypothetical protein
MGQLDSESRATILAKPWNAGAGLLAVEREELEVVL